MSHTLFNLSGKTALITGSSQGIGLGLAKGLIDAGANVVINGRDREKLAATAVTLENAAVSVHQLAFDVTQTPFERPLMALSVITVP
jgi:gluconate 5-dehydrogenase